jgi:phosphatidylserine/phosphatidylglycerophosphate/cardiolipin synthase-like enzyme
MRTLIERQHALQVFAIPAFSAFAILQSRIHEPWARLLSSSLGSALRYTASDCFETFAFPQPDPRTVRGASLLEPLWTAMRDRGVEARFFIHIEQAAELLPDPEGYGNAAVRGVMQEAWPFGDPRPRGYYDTRALVPRPRFNMHAKCVVVDGETALVTSANFTLRAHEQNTECGVLLEAPAFAHPLARQWLGLIDAGLLMEGHW